MFCRFFPFIYSLKINFRIIGVELACFMPLVSFCTPWESQIWLNMYWKNQTYVSNSSGRALEKDWGKKHVFRGYGKTSDIKSVKQSVMVPMKHTFDCVLVLNLSIIFKVGNVRFFLFKAVSLHWFSQQLLSPVYCPIRFWEFCHTNKFSTAFDKQQRLGNFSVFPFNPIFKDTYRQL